MVQLTLKFGDVEGKRAAVEFAKRSARRTELVEIGVGYFVKYVTPDEWPKEFTPICGYPAPFRRHPQSVLDEIARELTAKKNELRAKGGTC